MLSGDDDVRPTPDDFLLAQAVLRAHQRAARAGAVVRLALRRFPDNVGLQLAHARDLCRRGRMLRAVAVIDAVDNKLDDDEAAYADAVRAAHAGALHRKASYERLRQKVAAVDDAHVQYELAYGALRLSLWEASVEHAAKATALAPEWMRARALLAHAQLSAGDAAAAEETLKAALATSFDDISIELGLSVVWASTAAWAPLAQLLDDTRAKWGDAFNNELAPLHVLALWSSGEVVRAQALAEEAIDDDDLRTRFSTATPGPSAQLLVAPLQSQTGPTCVPTAVAMAAATRGHVLDVKELYAAMDGQHGTLLWRMAQVLRERGFVLRPVRADVEVLCALLDKGVSLLAPLMGVREHHIEVICGYDDGLQLLRVRDPSAPLVWFRSYDDLDEVYGLNDNVVWALTHVDDDIDVEEGWLAPRGERLLELQRALAVADVDEAQAAFDDLDGCNVETDIRRHLVASGVLFTPLQLSRMSAAWLEQDTHPVARAWAALQLADGAVLDRMLDGGPDDGEVRAGAPRVGLLSRREDLPLTRMLQLQRMMLHGAFADALQRIDRALWSGQVAAFLYAQRAEALQQLGRVDEAKVAIDVAVEMEPEAWQWMHQARALHARDDDYAAVKAGLDDAVAVHPDLVEPKLARAALLLAFGSDGVEVDGALQEATQMRPRLPHTWEQLCTWYLWQGARRRAREAAERAKVWLPDDECPPMVRAALSETPQTPVSPSKALASPTTTWWEEAAAKDDAVEAFASAWRRGDVNADDERFVALEKRALAGDLRWDQQAQLLAFVVHHLPVSSWALAPNGEHSVEAETLMARLAAGAYVATPALAFVQTLLTEVGVDLVSSRAGALLAHVQRWLSHVDVVTDHPALGLQWVELTRAAGLWTQARDDLRRLRRAHPHNFAAHLLDAEIATTNGDVLHARALWRSLATRWPGHPAVLDGLVSSNAQLAKWPRAILAQQHFMRRFVFSPDAYATMLKLRAAQGGEWLPPSSDQQARMGEAEVALVDARFHMEQGNLERSMARLGAPSLTSATAVDVIAERECLHVEVLLSQDEPKKAFAKAKEAAAAHPTHGTLQLLAALADKDHDPQRCARTCRTAMAAGVSHGGLAHILVETDRLDGVVEWVQHDVAPPHQLQVWSDVQQALAVPPMPSFAAAFAEAREALLLWGEAHLSAHHVDVARLQLAHHARAQGDLDLCRRRVDALREREPHMLALQMLDVELRMDEGDFSGALRLAHDLADDVQSAATDHLLADVLLHKDRKHQARKGLLTRLQAHPLDERTLMLLAQSGAATHAMMRPLYALLYSGDVQDLRLVLVAVDVALAEAAPVPVGWFGLAMQRMQQLLSIDPAAFSDDDETEMQRLAQCIAQFAREWQVDGVVHDLDAQGLLQGMPPHDDSWVPTRGESAASTPGYIQPAVWTYARFKPAPFVSIAAMAAGVGAAAWAVSSPWALAGWVLPVVAAWLWRQRVRQHFMQGCANPAVVVDVEPTRVAILTDLSRGHVPAPHIRVVDMALPTELRTVGARLGVVCMYLSDDDAAPNWSDIDPLPAAWASSDANVWQRLLNAFDDDDWDDLDAGLRQLPQPLATGLHPLEPTKLLP